MIDLQLILAYRKLKYPKRINPERVVFILKSQEHME